MQKQQTEWLLDYQVEERTGGRISASRLRKDRVGKQLFPFHRVGASCFYSLDEINDVIARARVGGKAA
jgi:hypothetical protein